jgi:hypothetical protein
MQIIVLGTSTLEKIREYYQREHREKLASGNRWIENDLILPTTVGAPSG